LKTIPYTHEDAKNVIRTFCNQVFWLRTIRHIYELLFENDESITLMNKTAPSFFDDLSKILRNYILLEFSKITDPAATYGNENLTVDNLIQSIDWPQDLQDKLTVLSNKAKDFRSHILGARHKQLAHIDKKASLAGKTLGAFPEGKDEVFLKTLQEVCDITHKACFGTIVGQMILAKPGDVINFRKALENAVAFNQLLSESSGQEMIRLLSYLEKARRPDQFNKKNSA
jgi:hypothetical protein